MVAAEAISSYPPQRRRESRVGECRAGTQAQRHRTAGCGQALQFGRQYPQPIEGGEGEGLTALGHWTSVARWNRRHCICVDCPARHDLALLDRDEPRTLGI